MAMLSPVVTGESSFVQLITDMLSADTLTWTTAILLHDASVSREMLGEMNTHLRESASVATYDISTLPVRDTLEQIPARLLGYKFFVIGTEEKASEIFITVSRNSSSPPRLLIVTRILF